MPRTKDVQRGKKSSLHGQKFNPNPKFLGTAEAYCVELVSKDTNSNEAACNTSQFDKKKYFYLMS